MYAIAPNGLPIIGTLETLTARADVHPDMFQPGPDGGEPTYEHEGYTEIWWESQKTEEQDGKTVFLDDQGNEWTHDQLKLVDRLPEEEAA